MGRGEEGDARRSWWSELGVDLLEELLARHRRRVHAEGTLRRATVALGGRRRAAVREGYGVEALFVRRAHRRTKAVLLVSNSQPPLAFAGLNTRADLDELRPILSLSVAIRGEST